MTYHGSVDETLKGVRRLMQEGHAHAVKMEGGVEIADTVKAVVQAGVPVLGHIGLTPQSVNQIGGYRIQGKDAADAKRLMDEAKALEAAGAFGIVLELVTEEVARAISKECPSRPSELELDEAVTVRYWCSMMWFNMLPRTRPNDLSKPMEMWDS